MGKDFLDPYKDLGAKDHVKGNYYSQENGRSYVYITCPFCDYMTMAYVWSLAGCGKKCRCGAVHCSIGITFPKDYQERRKKAIEKFNKRK